MNKKGRGTLFVFIDFRLDRCIASKSLREIADETGLIHSTLQGYAKKRPYICSRFALYGAEYFKTTYKRREKYFGKIVAKKK
jgi:hypothetical protein